MRKIVMPIIVLCFFTNLFATKQLSDLIIVNGDTLTLHTDPLQPYLLDKKLEMNDFTKDFSRRSDCWKGYRVIWRVENNKLFLESIQSCDFEDDKKSADLEKIFHDKVNDGRVFADWYSDELWVPSGKKLYTDAMYGTIRERDVIFSVEAGKIVNKKELKNNKTRISPYQSDPQKLRSFVNKKINWKSLGKISGRHIVVVEISSDEKGKVSNAKIIQGSEDVYKKEALRVVNSIPEWTVVFSRGRKLDLSWRVAIEFSDKLKKRNTR